LTNALDEFEINQATKILYDFIWHDFCDWYVEMLKSRLYGDESNEVKRIVLSRAITIFDNALRLLHPFMPFVTEELWQHLDSRNDGESIMVAPFPVQNNKWVDKKTEEEMAFVQDVINSVRNVRGELTVPPSKEISLLINFQDETKSDVIKKYRSYFQRLARVTKIEELKNGKRPHASASAVVAGGEVFIPLEGIINLDTERERIQKEITRVEGLLTSTEKKLQNESFIAKAPKDVVEKEREKLTHVRSMLEKLRKILADLS
jgi:valyl-tRNA synthetase